MAAQTGCTPDTITTAKPSAGYANGSIHTPPTTPTTLSSSAHQLLNQIRHIHQELCALTSLAPGEKINAILTSLVKICTHPYDAELANHFLSIEGVDRLCRSLQHTCALAEGELESHWAHCILNSSHNSTASQARRLLLTFPYYTNYLDLSRLESSLLTSFLSPADSPRNIAFIGSGPLPLTSLCLLDIFPHCTVHNVDRDAAALAISERLVQRLGAAERMSFTLEDVSVDGQGKREGEGVRERWGDFDVVFLAALVGMGTPTKLGILSLLARRLRSGTLVVARSARGLRSVLYPVLELSDDLQNIGYHVLAEVHPWTSVVNSVIVLKVN